MRLVEIKIDGGIEHCLTPISVLIFDKVIAAHPFFSIHVIGAAFLDTPLFALVYTLALELVTFPDELINLRREGIE